MSESTQPYQRLPSMGEDTYSSLRADIAANGVEDPIHIDEDGAVIDGHHRVEICEELGIDEYPTKIHAGLTEQEKTDLAYKLNLQERHLSHGQKQELVEQYLEEDWDGDNSGEWYDDVATTLGVGASTVRRAFTSLKDDGKLAHLSIFPKSSKRQQVRDHIDENPDVSNRDVADSVEADVSYKTVGNWRNEWEDDEGDGQYEDGGGQPSFSTFSPSGSEEDRKEAKRTVEAGQSEEPEPEHEDDGEAESDVGLFTSQETDEWSSPREVVEPIAESIGGFALDPCSGAEQSPFADETYTEDDDGLSQPWHGDVWVNPPYSDMSTWTEKAVAESERGDVKRVVYLCKGDSSTQWWQSAIEQATAVCAIDGRLSFGDGGNSAPFASHIFVFGALSDGLTDALRDQGALLTEVGGDDGE